MSSELKHQCLARLPDGPRWVETRDLLLNSNSLVQGDAEHFVVWHCEHAIGSVVGRPVTLPKAALACDELLAFSDNHVWLAERLDHFSCEPANIYLASKSLTMSKVEHQQNAAPLSLQDIETLIGLDNGLYAELQQALFADVDTQAIFTEGHAVAFAYVASQSEGYWDMSIDTLAAYRGKGYAQAAVKALIQQMQRTGKRPVWGLSLIHI